jgi:acyl-CoA reductase-like NAD-dependent aldehyde dehydrogenase
MDPSMSASIPSTHRCWASLQRTPIAEVEAGCKRAGDAFGEYRRRPFAERAILVNRAAQILESEKDGLARMITMEMGKVGEPLFRKLRNAPSGAAITPTTPSAFLPMKRSSKTRHMVFVRHQLWA